MWHRKNSRRKIKIWQIQNEESQFSLLFANDYVIHYFWPNSMCTMQIRGIRFKLISVSFHRITWNKFMIQWHFLRCNSDILWIKWEPQRVWERGRKKKRRKNIKCHRKEEKNVCSWEVIAHSHCQMLCSVHAVSELLKRSINLVNRTIVWHEVFKISQVKHSHCSRQRKTLLLDGMFYQYFGSQFERNHWELLGW